MIYSGFLCGEVFARLRFGTFVKHVALAGEGEKLSLSLISCLNDLFRTKSVTVSQAQTYMKVQVLLIL
jgi:hypothetical protein